MRTNFLSIFGHHTCYTTRVAFATPDTPSKRKIGYCKILDAAILSRSVTITGTKATQIWQKSSLAVYSSVAAVTIARMLAQAYTLSLSFFRLNNQLFASKTQSGKEELPSTAFEIFNFCQIFTEIHHLPYLKELETKKEELKSILNFSSTSLAQSNSV